MADGKTRKGFQKCIHHHFRLYIYIFTLYVCVRFYFFFGRPVAFLDWISSLAVGACKTGSNGPLTYNVLRAVTGDKREMESGVLKARPVRSIDVTITSISHCPIIPGCVIYINVKLNTFLHTQYL